MFGDEFDLPISEGSLSGDQVRFIVTTNNYYNGIKTNSFTPARSKTVCWNSSANGSKAPEDKAGKGGPARQTLKLRRLN